MALGRRQGLRHDQELDVDSEVHEQGTVVPVRPEEAQAERVEDLVVATEPGPAGVAPSVGAWVDDLGRAERPFGLQE